jgi:hypothetical protein
MIKDIYLYIPPFFKSLSACCSHRLSSSEWQEDINRCLELRYASFPGEASEIRQNPWNPWWTDPMVDDPRSWAAGMTQFQIEVSWMKSMALIVMIID